MSLPSEQELYVESSEHIITHYKELVEHTRNTLFPEPKIRYIDSANLQGISGVRRVILEIFTPHPSSALSQPFSYLVWLFCFLFWSETSVTSLRRIVQIDVPNVGNSSNSFGPFIIILATTIFLVFPLILYCYTVWFLFTKRLTWTTRTTWFLLLVLILSFLYIYIQTQHIPSRDLMLILNDPSFKFLFFLVLLPTLLFVAFNVLFLGKWFIELSIKGFNSFVSSHQPVPYETLRQVIRQPVKSKKVDWYVSELDKREIKALKELATDNLVATEKKTIPIGILIAIIAFLATLPFFQQFFGNIILWIANRILEVVIVQKSAASLTFGRIAFDMAIIGIMTFIIGMYVYLFQNLFIQGIIVQACSIAEYAQEQVSIVDAQSKAKPEIRNSISNTLIRFIYFWFGK